MKEPYIEGVATHDGPESCVVDREVQGEALTGACTGTVLSREITYFGVPTSLGETEGNTGSTVMTIHSGRFSIRESPSRKASTTRRRFKASDLRCCEVSFAA